MWVYIKTEDNLWTVGFYSPSGSWHLDSDHKTKELAAKRVHWLNGGRSESAPMYDSDFGRITGTKRPGGS